jgi:hypothetical protein
MSSRMPPIPPANRSKKGRGSDPEMLKEKSIKHEPTKVFSGAAASVD